MRSYIPKIGAGLAGLALLASPLEAKASNRVGVNSYIGSNYVSPQLAAVDGGLVSAVILLFFSIVGGGIARNHRRSGGSGRIPTDREIDEHPERYPGACEPLPWNEGPKGPVEKVFCRGRLISKELAELYERREDEKEEERKRQEWEDNPMNPNNWKH